MIDKKWYADSILEYIVKRGGFQDPSSNQGPERNSDSISLKDRVTVARLGNYSRLFSAAGIPLKMV